MKFTQKTILLLAALTIASCGEKSSDPAQAESTVELTQADAQTGAVKPYPLETCLVSGEKLGSMGEPVTLVHDGQELKFCCKQCPPKFKADPEKYLAQLEAAKSDS